MLATQEMIESLALRIERAYVLRQPVWLPACSAPGVWAAAAATLLRVHRDHPSIPLDPELYVAAQSISSSLADPWADLVQASSARRYVKRVRRIIATLRLELRYEVRRAHRRIDRGESIAAVLITKSRSLSPLGRYIVARRTGRDDLADRLRTDAANQHWMCPLYRQASLSMLSPESYPVGDLERDGPADPLTRIEDSGVDWN